MREVDSKAGNQLLTLSKSEFPVRYDQWSRYFVLPHVLNKLLSRLLPQRDFVRYQNVRLPAKHLRFCTTDWQDDDFFVQSAERDVDRLISSCGITNDSSLLDIGSGQGRLAIGLIRKLPLIRYSGVDIDARSVDWCQRNVAAYYPNFRFSLLDVRNERYNPNGSPIGTAFRLPGADGEFQCVFLYSVFTHMMAADVAPYLREIRRMLSPTGRVLMSVYMEPSVPDEQENPMDYLPQFGPPSRPLHRVRFNHDFFSNLIKDAGLKIVRFDYKSEEMTGQSVLVAGIR